MGLILGYLRVASDSVVPPALMHIGFNGLAIVDLLMRDKPPADNETMSLELAMAGLGVTALCLLVVPAVTPRLPPDEPPSADEPGGDDRGDEQLRDDETRSQPPLSNDPATAEASAEEPAEATADATAEEPNDD